LSHLSPFKEEERWLIEEERWLKRRRGTVRCTGV
jgi:hypothetical protein